MKTAVQFYKIEVMTGTTSDGYYTAVAHAHLDLPASVVEAAKLEIAEYETDPEVSRSRARAISYALTSLATMFDRGEVKEAGE